MSTTLRLETGGEWNLLVGDLLGAARDIASPRRLLGELGTMQERNIRQRVGRRESVNGGTYRASKRAIRDGGQTLVDRGQMIGNLGVMNWQELEIEVGFSSARERNKALWHQEGTRRGLPPRPFFGLSRNDETVLLDHAERWRDRILGGHRL